jgi:hypothetical protein
MKTLKGFLTVAILFVGTSLFAQNVINANEIDITLDGSVTREQLNDLATQTKANGLIFKYAPTFNAQRVMTSLEYKIYNADASVELVHVPRIEFTSPSIKTRFHFTKTAGVFTKVCAGTECQ